MAFAVEGYIEKGKHQELSLELIEEAIRNSSLKRMPQVIEIDKLPFTNESYVHLVWDNQWGISIVIKHIDEQEDFQTQAQLYADIASKEDAKKAEIIRNADRKLYIRMGIDPDDDYLSSVGIIVTEILQSQTGCVYFIPQSKELF